MDFLLILFFAGLIAFISICVFFYFEDDYFENDIFLNDTFLDEIASCLVEPKKGMAAGECQMYEKELPALDVFLHEISKEKEAKNPTVYKNDLYTKTLFTHIHKINYFYFLTSQGLEKYKFEGIESVYIDGILLDEANSVCILKSQSSLEMKQICIGELIDLYKRHELFFSESDAIKKGVFRLSVKRFEGSSNQSELTETNSEEMAFTKNRHQEVIKCGQRGKITTSKIDSSKVTEGKVDASKITTSKIDSDKITAGTSLGKRNNHSIVAFLKNLKEENKWFKETFDALFSNDAIKWYYFGSPVSFTNIRSDSRQNGHIYFDANILTENKLNGNKTYSNLRMPIDAEQFLLFLDENSMRFEIDDVWNCLQVFPFKDLSEGLRWEAIQKNKLSDRLIEMIEKESKDFDFFIQKNEGYVAINPLIMSVGSDFEEFFILVTRPNDSEKFFFGETDFINKIKNGEIVRKRRD